MRAFAKAARFAHASGVQRYLDEAFTKALPLETATRFADALEGLGEPAIERSEVFALCLIPSKANGIPVHMEGASLGRMKQDLPVFGSAMGSPLDFDGIAIEQTSLNQGEVIQYVRRPIILEGRSDAYGLYVHGSSMDPVHLEGDLVIVETKRPPRIGDDIVLYLRPEGEEDDGERARCVLIKRLMRRTAHYYELRQFNPDHTFRIETSKVMRTDRVLRLADLIG